MIRKPHGTSGSVKVSLLPDIELDFLQEEPVFLIIDGKPVPFFIDDYKEAGGEPIIHFEQLNSVDHANELSGLDLFVGEKCIILNHDLTPAALIGYKVTDQKLGPLGVIIFTFSSGQHDVLVMLYREHEVLIPFDPDLFDDIDEKSQMLYSQLPDGLVQLYLNEEEE